MNYFDGTKMVWMRICCHCNGLIFKGEGRKIDRCKNDGTQFWQHKSINLCKKRHNLRILEDIKKLMKEK